MSYPGEIIEIPLGSLGLRTDDPHTLLDGGHLIKALNVSLQSNRVEKDFGSRKWNRTALPASVISATDWFPNEVIQRLIAFCADGNIYRFIDIENYAALTAIGLAPGTLNTTGFVTMVLGGQEEPGNERKIFFMNGYDPIQVISGDGTTRRNISNGAADWTGTTHPFFGIIHRGRMWALGNDPHRIYVSLASDQEDFTTAPLQFSIFPGEGEKLVTARIFKGRLYILKYPLGLYALNDSDASSTNWFFEKVHGSFGGASNLCTVEAFDDVLVGNNFGGITSIKAVQTFGDIAASDMFSMLRCQDFVRNEINRASLIGRQCVYYQDKKLIYFTFQSNSGTQIDRICQIDMNNTQYPKITWITKDQPNCLFLKKDDAMVDRPYYGSTDGYIYEMDQVDRWVGAVDGEGAYTMDTQTPWMDFGKGNPKVAETNKLFDHLEVVFEPTGDWDLKIDVFIDEKFHRTMNYNMSGDNNLENFVLDQDLLGSGPAISTKKELNGMGRRISFRCYNEGNGENVKIVSLRLYMRLSGQQQKGK